MLLSNFLLFAAFALVLVVSGSYLVKYLSKIATYLRINEFAISFILVAMSTSVPELFVGVTSALEGTPELSLGNVIGANIVNLTIVIGIPVLLARKITVSTKAAQADVRYMFMISALPLTLMILGDGLSRIDGGILLLVFVLYIYNLLRQERTYHKMLQERFTHWDIIKDMSLFLVSLGGLFLGANYVVKYAQALALDLQLPAIMIGLLLLSLGTSLPELTFNIRSVMQKHPEMALGDTIGSVVANSALVLGIVAIIHPIDASFLLYLTSWLYMLLVGFLFFTFVEGKDSLTWREGVAMVLLYSFFILIEFYIKGTALPA